MDYIIYNGQLYHHGVKGQKWGVRRYQNKDGSLTAKGKSRNNSEKQTDPAKAEKRKKVIKGVAIGTASVAAITATAVLVARSPKARTAIKSIRSMAVDKLKDGASKNVEKGKRYMKKAGSLAKEGAKEGVKTGIKDGVSKAVSKSMENVLVGVTMNTVKRSLDATVGRAEAERIFKANDKKKVGSFWKAQDRDSDDE